MILIPYQYLWYLQIICATTAVCFMSSWWFSGKELYGEFIESVGIHNGLAQSVIFIGSGLSLVYAVIFFLFGGQFLNVCIWIYENVKIV